MAESPSDVRLLIRIASYGWQYLFRWVSMLLTTLVVGLMSGGLFLALKLLLDLLQGDTKGVEVWANRIGIAIPDPAAGLNMLASTMAVISIPTALAAWISWYLGQWLANQANRDLRSQIIEHLVDLDLQFHASLSRGDMLTRLTADLASTQNLFQTTFGKILQRPATAIGTVVVLFTIKWELAIVVFILLAPIAVVLSGLLKQTRRRSRNARQKMATNVSVLEQITSGIRVIKAMGSAQAEVTRYDHANSGLFAANMKLARSRATTDAVTHGAIYLLSAAILWASVWIMARGWMTVSEFIAFTAGLGQLTSLLRSANRSWGDIQTHLPSAERVFELLDQPLSITDKPQAMPAPVPRQGLHFKDVTFAYGDEAVLRNFSLSIPVGSSIALVGASGAGKSTILNLLPRFYDPQSGSVRWDNTDIRDYQWQSLVKHIAIVQQESFLFAGSVADNIRYGRPDATDADIEAAAKQAHLHDDVLRLEGGNGYATEVGDRGDRLSGGQRQRVAIARAFLRNAPILLLDEPTSALDADAEAHVQKALTNLLAHRTAVIIAHRLSTIQHCDRIIVLAKGHGVVEHGSHAELMAANGEYARLVRLQTLK